jgi:hypothetical protein
MSLLGNTWTDAELTERVQEVLKSPEMQQSLTRSGARDFWIAHFTKSHTPWKPNTEDQQLSDIINGLVLSYAYSTAYVQYQNVESVCNFMDALDQMWSEEIVSEEELDELATQLPDAYLNAIETSVTHAYATFHKELSALPRA